MTIDHTSLPKPHHEDQRGAAFFQDRERRETGEEDFVVQVVERARKEWEAFHLRYPDVDEETFCQAQRFCVQEWFLQKGTLLSDLRAFVQAQKHFEYEIQERAAEIQATSIMIKYTYREAQSSAVRIATQALQRGKRSREVIGELSSNKGCYLVKNVNQLRTPGQVQDREKEAEARGRRVRQEIENMKKLGIAIAYEKEKAKVQEYEKEAIEQLNYAEHLMRESQYRADTARDVTKFEAHVRTFDTLLKDLHLKTLDTYCVQDAVGTAPSDWDAATQRSKDAYDQLKAFAAFSEGIQGAITDALAKAKAEIEQAKSTQEQTHKVKQALGRMRKRSAELEKWAEQEKMQAKERKKQAEKARGIYTNVMIKARNDLFSKEAPFAVRLTNAPEKPGSGYQRVHNKRIEIEGLIIIDKESNEAANEAELENIYHQEMRRAEASPDPTRLGTGHAFRCAERFVQAKTIETLIQNEEQLQQAIESARSKTQQTIDTFKNIYTAFNEIKASHLKITERQVQFAKSLEKVKDALEQAALAAKNSAKDAFHQQTMDNRGAAANKTEVQARRTVQEEMNAYSHAKISLEYAIRYSREIASEHRKVEQRSKMLVEHFTAVCQSYLPWEKEVLDYAITGMTDIIKAAINVLRQEAHAQEAAYQTNNRRETAAGAQKLQLLASEQEALLLVALANDTLAQSAVSYRIFHKLATNIAKDHLGIDKEQLKEALEVLNTDLDEIKQEKESQEVQRQSTALAKAQSQAYLLINEQTGLLILKDGVAACFLQDLAGIAEADPQANPSQSKLFLFKGSRPWSTCDIPHDLLYETAEAKTSIHLQVPDGAGRQMPMLVLPNGTQIPVADIDLRETEHDLARPEHGVTITLKKDKLKINLLAAASVMTGALNKESLRELVDKSLDKSLNRIRSAVGTKRIQEIEEAFKSAQEDDRDRKYIDKYLLPIEDANRDHVQG